MLSRSVHHAASCTQVAPLRESAGVCILWVWLLQTVQYDPIQLNFVSLLILTFHTLSSAQAAHDCMLLPFPVVEACSPCLVHRTIVAMQCIQAMPEGVGQWVWVSDFKGFGMSDCDPRLAKVFLDLSAAHYPERLGLFLVIDAPWYDMPHMTTLLL